MYSHYLLLVIIMIIAQKSKVIYLCLFCHSSTKTKSGEARKIEEYVPKNIPAVSIRAKYLVETGPKK